MESHNVMRLLVTVSCVLLVLFGLKVQSKAQEAKIMPPSQSVAPAIVTADSGVKPSGTGKNWSKWYTLGIGKAPNGYTVEKVEFWLTGARSYGVSAECREVSRNDQQVVWEFRCEGNEEKSLPAAVLSEGHIRVIYRPR